MRENQVFLEEIKHLHYFTVHVEEPCYNIIFKYIIYKLQTSSYQQIEFMKGTTPLNSLQLDLFFVLQKGHDTLCHIKFFWAKYNVLPR